MSRTVPVRPDGKITLPLLNDVEAAGLTPMEFRDVLVKTLTEYMPAPEVSVIVIDPRSFKVSVMGEVPQARPLRAPEPDHRARHAGAGRRPQPVRLAVEDRRPPARAARA